MKKVIALLLCASIISACGWHLRGSQMLDTDLQALNVIYTDQYSELATTFDRMLKQYGIDVVPADKADYSVSISPEKMQRRSVSVSGNGLAAQYEVAMMSSFRITGPDYDSGLVETSVSRIYDYDQNDTVGKQAEERLIQSELRQELTNRVLRQVNALIHSHTANPPSSHE